MNKRLHPILVASLLSLPACQGGGASTGGATAEVKTDEQKAIYSLGYQMGKSVSVFKLSPQEQAVIKRGLSDSLNAVKPDFDTDAFRPKLQELARSRSQAASSAEMEKSKDFLDKAAKEPGAEKTASGLVIKTLTPGTGKSPVATDKVKVHYHGTLIDGTVFDSSVKRGTPAEFPLRGVIPCWTEGLQKMKVGGKSRLVCPSTIAYGPSGRPPTIPGGATLIFDVELLEILAPPPAPAPGTVEK